MPSIKNKDFILLRSEVGTSYYAPNHPMKPHRLSMTHSLVLAYRLHENLDVFRPRKATTSELAQFHAEDYVDFLSKNYSKYPARVSHSNAKVQPGRRLSHI